MAESLSFDGLPLLIPAQSLVLVAKRRGAQMEGRELIIAYIEDKYSTRPDWCRMLLQSLRLNAVVIIFDGVDEAPQLKDALQRLFTEELVPKRFRCVVTSRPDGVDQQRFEQSFIILDLQPVRYLVARALIVGASFDTLLLLLVYYLLRNGCHDTRHTRTYIYTYSYSYTYT